MRTMGRQGMVASPHYLATGAGVSVLRRGGTAVDAAIATNAVLAVLKPYACGLGGDLFAMVYIAKSQKLIGLNGSGRAPAEATLERIRELAGGTAMPVRGPLPVTVPGCVEAWGRLHERNGRLALRDLLADAISYAENGFPANKEFVDRIGASTSILHPDTPARETFLPSGRLPHEGQIIRQPRLAHTLRMIVDEGPETLYRGHCAAELVRSLQAVGGLISLEDLAEHRSEWVEPISVPYRDAEVYELPPNSQGIVALLMLSILRHLPTGPLRAGGAEYVHLLAEVQRLAYADRAAHLADLEHMSVSPQALLSADYARKRTAGVGQRASAGVKAGVPGDTVYLCTADRDGNLVSLIESNFMGIGSGIMAGETGIMLHNRGASFSLDPAHANVISQRKRPMHTLMPAMAFKQERPWLVFGSMGGSLQAQIHVELLTRLVDQGMHLDEALDAPRFDAVVDSADSNRPVLALEGRFNRDVIDELRRRGHEVRLVEPYSSSMGHANAIELLEDGVYVGATDPRTIGLALGY